MRTFKVAVLGVGALVGALAPAMAGSLHGGALAPVAERGWVRARAHRAAPPARAPRWGRAAHLRVGRVTYAGGAFLAALPCASPPLLVEGWCGPFAPAILYGRGPSYAAPLYNRPAPFE